MPIGHIEIAHLQQAERTVNEMDVAVHEARDHGTAFKVHTPVEGFRPFRLRRAAHFTDHAMVRHEIPGKAAQAIASEDVAVVKKCALGFNRRNGGGQGDR